MKSWESRTEKNWARKPLLRVSLAVALFSALQVEAGPITFNTGLPVATRQGIFRGQYVLFHASDDPTALDRSVTVQGVPFVIAYGATPRLALFGVVPYLHKSLEVNTPLGRRERTTSGRR